MVSKASPPDLIKVTELFLIPNSFIVAAIGTADTNPHRAAVSLLGLTISILWWICSHEALTDEAAPRAETTSSRRVRRLRILTWLPIVFCVGWTASTAVHVWLHRRPLGP